jgi:Bacterial PH domain
MTQGALVRTLAEFRAPWAKSLRISSGVTTALLLVVAAALATTLSRYGMGIGVAAAAFPLVTLVLSALWIVRGYALTESAILVLRPGWTTELPLTGLQSVTGNEEVLRGSIRLFGNGGLFVVTGLFWNRRLGRFRVFATDPSRAVILTYPTRKVVVTPHDPQQFILRVRTLLATKDFRA